MKTVLIADDEFDLTSTLKAILQHHGYGAEVCSNGREALQCAIEKRPDLVVLDVMMPLGNGFDVLEKMRGTADLERTPVVLMNFVPPPEDRKVQWQAFVQKPLSIGPLIAAVQDLIGPANK